MPSNSTFHFLRKKIYEEFNFQNDFEMKVGPNEIKLPSENEEDYALSVLGN